MIAALVHGSGYERIAIASCSDRGIRRRIKHWAQLGISEKPPHHRRGFATLDFGAMLDDLGSREIGRLMVEGGSQVHTQFLTHGLADELQLAIAPFFVGDLAAPRFVNAGLFSIGPASPMILTEVQAIGDVAFLRYALR